MAETVSLLTSRASVAAPILKAFIRRVDRAAALYPTDTLKLLTFRLTSAWEAAWQRQFDALEERFKGRSVWGQFSKQDEQDAEDEAYLQDWVKKAPEKAQKDYSAAWLTAAILAYIAAVGLEPKPKEKQIISRAATTAAAKQVAEHQKQIGEAVGKIEERLTQPHSLDEMIYAARQGLGDVAVHLAPTTTAKQGLERFLDSAFADTARQIDPVKGFKELHTSVDFQIRRTVGEYNRQVISGEAWRSRMETIFKDSYREAYRLGKLRKGGFYGLTPTDRAKLDRLVTDENKFFARWLQDARTKYLGLPEETAAARMQWRGGMYADALQGTFNMGWASVAEEDDEEVLWCLSDAEHCDTCIEEADLGWRKASELTRYPGDGSTECRTNCRCYLVTRDAKDTPSVPPTEAAGFAPMPPKEQPSEED